MNIVSQLTSHGQLTRGIEKIYLHPSKDIITSLIVVETYIHLEYEQWYVNMIFWIDEMRFAATKLFIRTTELIAATKQLHSQSTE